MSNPLLLEIADRLSLLLTEGRSDPFVSSIDSTAYNTFLNAKDKKYKWQKLQRLKQQKLISLRKHGNQIIATITNKGKAVALKEHLMRSKQKLPEDNQCFIVFDFPEDIRLARNVFRYLLKKIGCIRIQKSVWMTDRDVIKEMNQLIILMKCQNWVRLYIARQC